MRTWRVGTLSMGVTLILIGFMTLISIWQGLEAFDVLFSWWPIILILLGLEILVFLFIGRKEGSFIKYDLFSIFLVGLFFLSGFAFAVATSSGVLQEVRYALGSVESTKDLPAVKQVLQEQVDRVVVNTSYRIPVKVEVTNEDQLHMFGQYGATTHPDEQLQSLTSDDYMSMRIVGDTAYISVKDLPRKNGPFASYTWANVIMALPEGVKVEIRDQNHQIVHP